MRVRSSIAGVLATLVTSSTAEAHHEALFGPQSSLAVESEGFVSVQSHAHAYGINGAPCCNGLGLFMGQSEGDVERIECPLP